MAIPDRVMQIYARIWEIWAADTTDANGWGNLVKASNRIRYDLQDKPPARSSIDQGKPGDFPAVMLEVEDFNAALDGNSLTFGGERGSCGRETVVQVNYLATVASESLKIGQIDLLPIRMTTLLIGQPQNLGLDDDPNFVDGLGRIVARSIKSKKGMAAGTLRRVTTIRIPVNIYFPANAG